MTQHNHDLPPSAKLVRRVLEEAGEPLTARDLAREADLPRQTVYRALDRLEDAGVVESRPSTTSPPRREFSVGVSE